MMPTGIRFSKILSILKDASRLYLQRITYNLFFAKQKKEKKIILKIKIPLVFRQPVDITHYYVIDKYIIVF